MKNLPNDPNQKKQELVILGICVLIIASAAAIPTFIKPAIIENEKKEIITKKETVEYILQTYKYDENSRNHAIARFVLNVGPYNIGSQIVKVKNKDVQQFFKFNRSVFGDNTSQIQENIEFVKNSAEELINRKLLTKDDVDGITKMNLSEEFLQIPINTEGMKQKLKQSN